MARDKSRDDKFFNCGQEHEIKYVSGLYADSRKVEAYLRDKCRNGEIKYDTHMEVYQKIEKDLGYPIPW